MMEYLIFISKCKFLFHENVFQLIYWYHCSFNEQTVYFQKNIQEKHVFFTLNISEQTYKVLVKYE
jgi:hypothetical protein